MSPPQPASGRPLEPAGGRPPSLSTPEDRRQLFINSVGGVRGVIDSGLPVVVFVLANTFGGLNVAVWSAVAVGVAILGLRLARKQTLQQAFSGFLGIAVAALIAKQTGQAKDYFLLGIWGSLLYAGFFALSAVLRRPATGLIWEYVSPSVSDWRRRPALLRMYTATTLLWAALYVGRFVVQHYLYDSDQTGWLAVARLGMGYPLTIAVLAVTVLAGRRVRVREGLAESPAAPAG